MKQKVFCAKCSLLIIKGERRYSFPFTNNEKLQLHKSCWESVQHTAALQVKSEAAIDATAFMKENYNKEVI